MSHPASQTQTHLRPLAEVHDLRAYRQDRIEAALEEAQERMTRGHEDEALEATFRALSLDPRSYEALSLAGTLLAMLGDAKASAVYTREAIRVKPGKADAYYDLGATLLEIDQADEALEWLDAGIEKAEGRDDDLTEFLHSARIEALVQLGRMDEAQSALETARTRTRDALGLLEGCEQAIAQGQKKPRLRVV
ncbi:MAG: hypothetical protein P1V51_08980 [Deltaproteobacteria bacterium]|nr:hypothetical protein [Deltaproteobacteria bacterium]